MAATATKRWMKLCYARIPEQVGTFFEQMTRQLTRGVGNAKPTIDLQAWSVDSGIEVKGGDNTHSYRIPREQLARHADLAEFPYSRVLYFLYRYDNRLSHNGPTGLSRAKGAKARSLYLFRQMRDLTIVDHRILVAMARKRSRVRSGLLPMDPERECLNLPSRELGRFFSASGHEELKLLELEPTEWVTTQRLIQLESKDGFETHLSNLAVRTLLTEAAPAERFLKKAKRLTIKLPDLNL